MMFDLWVDWLKYCRQGSEPKEFKRRVDEMNRLYKRMDYREQGEYHQLVHDSHPKS